MLKVLIRIFIGLAFIFSGAVKLVPAEYLENDILRSGMANDLTAPFLARFVIGSEFFIGIILLSGISKRFSLKLSLASLLMYTLYLLYVILVFGNEGNCGCFGRQLELTPLEGILKNVALGGLSSYLLIKLPADIQSNGRRWLTIGIALLSMASPFVIYKVDLPEKITVNGSERTWIDFSPVYTDELAPGPAIDIRNGKVLVMFASLSCEHCRVAASKLELIKSRHPQWNVLIIYNGKEELISDFHRDAQLKNTPCFLFNDGEALARMVGVGFPTILLLENASVAANLNYAELQEANLETFFGD
jgi:thiol-disulfide isomerase/thioredoxin